MALPTSRLFALFHDPANERQDRTLAGARTARWGWGTDFWHSRVAQSKRMTAGRRRFKLFLPERLPNLAMGPIDPMPDETPISMANPLNPNLETHPRLKAPLNAALQAQFEPGDLILPPYGWYHHVQSLDPVSMRVNHWWNEASQDGGSPWDAMLHAIMSVRQLPATQRRAWLAMFRHYAFLCDGDPAAHFSCLCGRCLGRHWPG